ncbi:hypothetical protein J6590_039392 [Homalodisca vitripennis]|nr:hypothetical protein J6590_039392 [Homalodisca vitripennis]
MRKTRSGLGRSCMVRRQPRYTDYVCSRHRLREVITLTGLNRSALEGYSVSAWCELYGQPHAPESVRIVTGALFWEIQDPGDRQRCPQFTCWIPRVNTNLANPQHSRAELSTFQGDRPFALSLVPRVRAISESDAGCHKFFESGQELRFFAESVRISCLKTGGRTGQLFPGHLLPPSPPTRPHHSLPWSSESGFQPFSRLFRIRFRPEPFH